jgi:MFS family permease
MTTARPHRTRWLTSTVFGIGLASLASDLSHETVTAILPALLASMGAAAAALGTIEGVADGVSSAAKLWGGWWTDRVARRKPLCAAGYAGMAGATALIAAAASWPAVLAGRSLAWLSRGLRTPARKALLADAVTPQTYGRAFGFERMMDTLGAVLAPLAALLLLRLGLTHRALLWMAVVPALLAVLAIAALVRETPHRVPKPRPFLASFTGLPPPFYGFLRGVALFGAGDFAHSLMILYAVQALTPQMGPERAAAAAVGLYALHNAVYAGVTYPAGVAADRADKRGLLSAGYLLGAFTALLLAAGAGGLPFLALVFAMGGAYVGLEETLEDSFTAEVLPAAQRGSGFGLLAVVNGLGDMASSATVGWLWATAGPAVAFGLAAALMAAGAALVWFSRSDSR